jgi:hypothetical protein
MHPQVVYKIEQPQVSHTGRIISEATSLKTFIFMGFDKYLICFSSKKAFLSGERFAEMKLHKPGLLYHKNA